MSATRGNSGLRQSGSAASFRAHTRRIPSFLRQLIRSVKPSATHGNAVLRRNSAIELFSTSHVTLSAVLTLPVRVVRLSATRGNSQPQTKRLCRVFSHTHGASHRSRGSLSVPSSRPRRTESLNLRLNGATAFFQRHARRNQSFQRPLSRTHIVRDARKLHLPAKPRCRALSSATQRFLIAPDAASPRRQTLRRAKFPSPPSRAGFV